MKISTKYNGTVDLTLYKEHCVRSIFKILPLMEEGKDWKKYLEGFIVELSGIDSLIQNEVDFTSLIGKLAGLLQQDINLQNKEEVALFRKVIFDSIHLVKKLG